MWRIGSPAATHVAAIARFSRRSRRGGLQQLAAPGLLEARPVNLARQKPTGRFSDRRSRSAPQWQAANTAGRIRPHRDILRPQGLDPLSDITIVDVVTVNFEEVAECSRPVAGI